LSRSARRATAAGDGAKGATGQGDKSAGSGKVMACTSIGISMLTGPQGGVCASCTASRKTASADCGLRMRKACLPTERNMANWAGCS
jgi:hypothetical protein